jgi:polyphosphate kinase 2 (PPK2 family)
MLTETDHPAARWDVVPAESKPYARVRVIEIVIERVEAALLAAGQEPVDAAASL